MNAVRIAATWIALGSVLAQPAHAGPAAPVLRQEVRARLDVPNHRVDVVDVIRVASPAHGTPVRFLLHRDLAIREVSLTGDGRPAAWVDLPRWDPRHFWTRPPYGELDGFEIAREVEVPEPASGWPGGAVSLRVAYDGVLADSLHAPDRAYGHSFETTSGRIVAQGAFLSGGTFWVPWTGDALFSFDLTVDTPPDWRAVSQGDLESERSEPGFRRVRWVSRDPAEEIYLIAGPYRLHEEVHGDVKVLAYAYESTGPEILAPYLEATGPILDRYGEMFGEYPYGKFALVENYWQTGYGMPSFTFLGDRVIRLPFIVDTSYPHEILHNWWGNGVYLLRADGNWCEGLTTYCADYFAKEQDGPEAARDYRRSTLQGYRDFAAAGGKDFPLLGFRSRDSAATQAVGYGKTLMVFHMLRRTVGEDVFFRALRQFYETNRFRRAGWLQLRMAFESASGGTDLGFFFDEWIRRAGAPVLRLEGAAVAAVEDGNVVSGVIVQDGTAYDLLVPVVVEGAGSGRTVEVRASGPETPFRVPVGFDPELVSVDPDFDLFRMLDDAEVPAALSGVLGAASTRIVIGADVRGDLRAALRDVADEWARDPGVTVVEEGEEPLPRFDGGTWMFGEGSLVRELRAGGWPGREAAGAGTLVAAGRTSGDGEGEAALPIGLFLPESAGNTAAVAAKIPHYAKYSWLRFEETRNVAKGLWEPGASPLTVRLSR